MQIINKNIDELIAYDSNPRVHTSEQVLQISESIKEFGWTMPVLINEHNEIIAGHGRVLAGKIIGIKDVPCIVATSWSEAKKKTYCIADNKLTESSSWKRDFLKLNMQFIKDDGFNLKLTGFNEKALSNLIPDFNLSDTLEVSNPTTKAGEVWILGKNKLICSDGECALIIQLWQNYTNRKAINEETGKEFI